MENGEIIRGFITEANAGSAFLAAAQESGSDCFLRGGIAVWVG